MIKVNAIGDACPIPVVKTKNAIRELGTGGQVETLVDNEIAVQNLTKMAHQKGYEVRSEKLGEGEYRVLMTIPGAEDDLQTHHDKSDPDGGEQTTDVTLTGNQVTREGQIPADNMAARISEDTDKPNGNSDLVRDLWDCQPDSRKNITVVISSDKMGEGDEELGKALMKSFIFALSQQDQLPSTILLYNGGARMSTEGSPALEDLKSMEAEGVEILTCGTCLNHYGLTEKLAVGSVTNMYDIVEKMTASSLIVKP